MSSSQLVAFPEEAERDLNKGRSYSMPTIRGDEVQEGAHRAPYTCVSKAAPCPPQHSSPEQHNHIEPQGCSRSDLLKVKQAETEPWSPLFFQDSAFELELNHAKVNGGFLFLIVIFRGSPQTSEPPDRKMWTPCSVKFWAACQERDLPEQEEIALPFLTL